MSTCIKTSSIVPFGILIDLSARDSVMEVGFSSPKPSCFYMEYGSRFTLAPKSNSVFSTLMPPILTEIVGHPGPYISQESCTQ